MKKILSIVCTIVLSLIIVSCAKDIVDLNGSITGVVKDKQDNSTIAGCQVTISPSNITKTTTEAGHFVFENIDAGDYTLSFVKEGYLSATKDFSLVAGDKINTDVYLEKNKSMITASPEVLNFGDLETTKELFVSKVGSLNVQFSVKADADWISISPSSGVINNIGTKITVVVDRTNLSYGEYNSSITIVSSLGEVSVPVYLIKTEEAAPTVSNSGDFYDITETSMKVNAILSKTGGADVTAHGHCWSTKEEPTINDNKTNLGHIKEIGEFTSSITGLTAGETYYVRAYATNKLGTSYSNQMVITIPKIDKPIVKTLNADDLMKNSAKLHGTVANDGNGEIKECGFYYGTTESTPSKVSVSTPSDNFALVLTQLKEGTTYYYKAYAVNAKGESCGDVISFTTLADQSKAAVTTLDATNITFSSATLNGNILSVGEGKSKIVEYGFYVGENEYQMKASKVGTDVKVGNFNDDLKGLSSDEEYYYQAYVKCYDNSIVKGDVKTFFTEKKPYISYALFKSSSVWKSDGTHYFMDFTATAETYGRKIKDAGFLIIDIGGNRDATLHTINHTKIVKGKLSENTSSYSGETVFVMGSVGCWVRAYFVLEDGTEIYTPSTIREGRTNYLGENDTIEYKSSGK